MDRFFDGVQSWTERYLTKKKARRLANKRKKRTFLSETLEWIDAILFAVVVIFLVNQFLFQFFIIPSPSMLNTLLVKDRVMVSKLTYGLELFPQGPKILDSRIPDRDEIITFYNPQYERCHAEDAEALWTAHQGALYRGRRFCQRQRGADLQRCVRASGKEDPDA